MVREYVVVAVIDRTCLGKDLQREFNEQTKEDFNLFAVVHPFSLEQSPLEDFEYLLQCLEAILKYLIIVFEHSEYIWEHHRKHILEHVLKHP